MQQHSRKSGHRPTPLGIDSLAATDAVCHSIHAVLDRRGPAHRGHGPTASVEWAVSFCASVCLHLHHHGQQVRLVAEDSQDPVTNAPRWRSAVSPARRPVLIGSLASSVTGMPLRATVCTSLPRHPPITAPACLLHCP
jgi:hypothetical protein